MVDRTKNRSDKYQAYFNELLFSNDMMADFSERSGMAASFNDEERAILKEELLDLKDQLREEFWRLVDEELTDRQKSVMKLYADGNTQCEIAKVLGVNQCYSIDTEVLTEDGFKYFTDVKNKKIGCYNNDNGEIEFHYPTAHYISNYKGKMLHFINDSIDCLVTPNHRMLIKEFSQENGWKDQKTIFASDLLSKRGLYKFKKVTDSIADTAEFSGDYIAEINYNSTIWCFEVPTGLFVSKRNGKASIQANSSITKSLRGNCDYRNGRKVYGGSCRKLQKLAAKDEKIQNILKRIAEIQGDE